MGNYEDSGLVTASTGDKSYLYYYDEEYLQTELEQNNFKILEVNYRRSPVTIANALGDMIFIVKKT